MEDEIIEDETGEWFVVDTGKVEDLKLKIKYYTVAVKLNPKRGPAFYARGEAFYNLGKYRAAINDYTRAMALGPEHFTIYCIRGKAYFESERYQKAIEDWSKAIELNPKSAPIYYNRAVIYANQELPGPACDDFYQAGLLFLKQKEKDYALRCVDAIKEVNSSSPLIKKLMDKTHKRNNRRGH